MTDSSRAYNTNSHHLYYQGAYGSTRKRSSENGRSGPYNKSRDNYESLDPNFLDERKWADMTPPPSPTSCHKIKINSVYDEIDEI